MLCSKCGSELGEDKICPKCGTTASNLFATEEYDPLKALDKEEHVIWQEAPIVGEENIKQSATENVEEVKQVETTNNNVAKGIKAAKSTLSNPIKPKNRIKPQNNSQGFKTMEVDLEKAIENIPEETSIEDVSVDEKPIGEIAQQNVTETLSQPITENVVETVEETSIPEPLTPAVEETITKTIEEEPVADEIVEPVTTTEEVVAGDVVIGDVVIGDVIGDDVVDIFDDYVEEEPVTPTVEKTAEPITETQPIVEETTKVEENNVPEPVTQEELEEVKIEAEPIVTPTVEKPVVDEPIIEEANESIIETEDNTEIGDIIKESSDSTEEDKDVVDIESLLQDIKGTNDKEEIPDISEVKANIAKTRVEEESTEPIVEEIQEDTIKTESIVEDTSVTSEPEIKKIVEEESPVIKSISSTSDQEEQVVKKIVPENKDEDIQAKFNRNFEDELSEIDVDENINSLTSKITTVLIIVLILIIAVVLATFLVQNIGL